jgi:acetylornithine deacetylase/succinyl-diaminopimelate desuccinylase-like protein
MTDFKPFVDANEASMLEELKALLRIPSISTDPKHDGDCRKAAEWLGDHLRKLGCTVEYLASDTHPIVWAVGPAAPGRPTVLVYGHYDVQPPDPLNEWTSPPFEPTVRNGDLFARGATDDKGQVFATVKAFEAVLARGRPPVNVRFLLEGQEESGPGAGAGAGRCRARRGHRVLRARLAGGRDGAARSGVRGDQGAYGEERSPLGPLRRRRPERT